MIPPIVIVAAVSAAVAAGGVWAWQANSYGRQITELKSEYLKAQFNAVEKAHAETIKLQDQKDEAEKKSQARQATLVAAVKSSNTALARLSDAANANLSAAQESHGACLANASTFRVVFGQCSARLVEVGKDAQGHLEDKRTLVDSWPNNTQ